MKDEVQASEGHNATFYSFLGLKQSANQDDINKAYRKLSRSLHPDKARSNWLANYNKPPKPSTKPGAKPTVHVQKNKQPSQGEINRFNKEASARFERLSLVANVLRGPARDRYDHFLANGFPKWRGTGYYYQRFRPGLGTVLLGLFVFVGGGVHYGALYLSWKRQREFVDRYIRDARRKAWGDEGSIGAIPGLGGTTSNGVPAPQQAAQDNDESMQWNRKQKRAMEKEKKREGKNPSKNAKAADKAKQDGISTPQEAELISGPVGAKKRTVAENGKVLIVDSVGNVFLEEETEEGDVQEFLLDVRPLYSGDEFNAFANSMQPDEVPAPTIQNTFLVRLPVFLYNQSLGRVLNKQTPEHVEWEATLNQSQEDETTSSLHSAIPANANGETRKRKAKTRS